MRLFYRVFPLQPAVMEKNLIAALARTPPYCPNQLVPARKSAHHLQVYRCVARRAIKGSSEPRWTPSHTPGPSQFASRDSTSCPTSSLQGCRPHRRLPHWSAHLIGHCCPSASPLKRASTALMSRLSARIKANADIRSLREHIAAVSDFDFGSFDGHEFHLYESRPSARGSVYTKLATYDLMREKKTTE